MIKHTIWILSDGLAGHYNQSVGISNALQPRMNCEPHTIHIHLKFKFLRFLMRIIANKLPLLLNKKVFNFFYTHDAPSDQKPTLIISAGGNTLFANIALGKEYSATNVFSGTLKGYEKSRLSKVFTVTPLNNVKNNVVLDLPPANTQTSTNSEAIEQQPYYALLIGGDGAGYKYTEDDWKQLAQAMKTIAERDKITWKVTTSRRTGEIAETQLKTHLKEEIATEAIWFSTNPQKVVKRFLNESQIIFCTEDSLTMVSEAIYAHKPVVTLQPKIMNPVDNDSKALDKYQLKQFIIRSSIALLHQAPLNQTSFCKSYPNIQKQISDEILGSIEGQSSVKKRILWWGRQGNYGPNYPRNRTIINCLKNLGHEIIEFQPRLSKLAHIEATFHHFSDIDMVWVPCFRQRDLASASRWAKKNHVLLVFDPLISAYDKRVNEKKKFPSTSIQAQRLLKWEQQLFSLADVVIADTACHKKYFIEQLSCKKECVEVIPVSAEEELFFPKDMPIKETSEILFFGTFIGLQGPTYIAEAVNYYDGPPIKLVFLGDGPEREACEKICQQNTNPKVEVQFEDWIPFHDLPERIHQSDICLGVFGTGEKSFRVIPNKVYQALACGKPVITMKGDAYPSELSTDSGIDFVSAGNPDEIANSIRNMLEKDPVSLSKNATKIYSEHFSNKSISLTLTTLTEGF